MRYKKLVKNIVTSMVAVTLVSGFTSVQASNSSTNHEVLATSSGISGLSGLKTLTEVDAENEANGTSDVVIASSSSAKKNVDPTTVKTTVAKENVVVTDAEVKADFRYGLTPAQQKKNSEGSLYTNYRNNCLEMRIKLEKMFDTQVTKSGGTGKLYYGYFAGSTSTETYNGYVTYARAFVNSQFSKDIETNKVALAKLAADTFADIDGTESYAHLIPTAVYYGLIDTETVTAEKAAKSNGKYKEGDILTYAKSNLTYSKLSKIIAGYDGYAKNVQSGKLLNTDYKYMGNLDVPYADEEVLNLQVVNKNVTRGEVVDSIMRTSYLLKYRSVGAKIRASKSTGGKISDFTKWAKELDEMASLTTLRAHYMNCIANPSNGVPGSIGVSMLGAEDAGINVRDSKGASNWYKVITLGDAIELFNQAARIDE